MYIVITYKAIYFKSKYLSTSLGILEFVYIFTIRYNMCISTTIYTSMNRVLLWGRGLKTICCPYLDCYLKFFRKQQQQPPRPRVLHSLTRSQRFESQPNQTSECCTLVPIVKNPPNMRLKKFVKLTTAYICLQQFDKF